MHRGRHDPNLPCCCSCLHCGSHAHAPPRSWREARRGHVTSAGCLDEVSSERCCWQQERRQTEAGVVECVRTSVRRIRRPSLKERPRMLPCLLERVSRSHRGCGLTVLRSQAAAQREREGGGCQRQAKGSGQCRAVYLLLLGHEVMITALRVQQHLRRSQTRLRPP